MSVIEKVIYTAPDGTSQTVGKLDCSTEFAVLTLENKSDDSYILSGYIKSEGNGSFYVEGVKTLPTSPTWQHFSIIVPANVSQLKITFETDIYYIYKWLFEQGTKQTSWAPSPEDVDAQIGDVENRVSSAESSITQNAEKIESKVSKDGVVSAINQSAESVTINASKINFNGVVTANEHFRIDEEGNATAKDINILDNLNIKPDGFNGFCNVLQASEADFGSGIEMSDEFEFISSFSTGLFMLILGNGLSGIKIPVPIRFEGTVTALETLTAKNINSEGSIRCGKDLLALGSVTAKNFERGTVKIELDSQVSFKYATIPLSFTPTETTQCVVSVRTSGTPFPRYLNCWVNYVSVNGNPVLQACLTAGGNSATLIPTGTYYIDYIAANV